MKIAARDIDHLTITLPDPASVAVKLQQLGFNLTPEGVEPRCICFQPADDEVPNYIELIEGQGAVLSLALNVEELKGEERTHAWETDDGFEVDAGVVVGEMAGPLPWFPVKHETPDAFIEPQWIVHPNGVLAFMAIHAVAEDPNILAKDLVAAWGEDSRTEEIFSGCTLVRAGGVVELLIWSPSAYEKEYKAIQATAPKELPAVAGVAFAVERARPLQALLRANNVAFAVTEGDRVLVGPEQAGGGLVIEFMPQN